MNNPPYKLVPELEERFSFQCPEEGAHWSIDDLIRKSFHSAAYNVYYNLADCRERAMALTKLEEGFMWALAPLKASSRASNF